jgi:hypothetical protein
MRLAMAVVALGVLLGSAPAQGYVVAAKPLHDFGVVEQGVGVEHQFALKNQGRSWVRIDGAQSSCDCTVAASDGQLVRPGDITWVRVRLDTTKLSGRTTKTVTLRTSDARTPAVQLGLTGVVQSDLVVSPIPIYMGFVPRGDSARRELLVSPGRPGDAQHTVSTVETDSPNIRAYIWPGDKKGQQKVIVEVNTFAPPGRFSDHVIIRTTSPRQAEITVPVFGQVSW